VLGEGGVEGGVEALKAEAAASETPAESTAAAED